MLGRDWQKVQAVEAPPGSTMTPPPYENPGGLGHPMAYQGGQADIVDVAPVRDGFVAVGFLETAAGPKAAAWSSADGVRWNLVPNFPANDGSVIRAVAVGAPGVVAVGADGPHAAAWRSVDGVTWQRSSAPGLVAAAAEMSAVLATPAGFVAGGRVGGLGAEPRAAFWSSADGNDWTSVADSADMAASRVEGFASASQSLVAVGSAVEGTTVVGGAAWTSSEGTTWRRVASPALRLGPMHSVTTAAAGFLAVGTDVAGKRAVVWSSADGRDWRSAPDAEALDNHGLQIEMRDVARVADGYVAVGHLLFGTQYPSGVIWSSPDGVSWTRAPDAPMFQQAKLFGVTATRDRVVAVGTFGSPDFAIPTIWLSPPH